jgi:ribonuclease-3
VVTNHIFNTYPELPEGELAKVRASVVSSAALAEVAADLELGDALLLGKGEDQSGGREKPSILADAMEAVIGAVYLDAGWDGAHEFVMRLLGERIAEAAAGPGGQDFKTRLQELAARSFDELPRYDVVDEGPDHAKRFFAAVSVAGQVRGRGEGRSKKQAEQAAARVAWQDLSTAAQLAASVLAPPVPPVPTVPPESAAAVDAAQEAAADPAPVVDLADLSPRAATEAPSVGPADTPAAPAEK